MYKIDVYGQYFTLSSLHFSKLIFKLRDFNDMLRTYKLVTKKKNKYSKPEVVTVVDKEFYIVEREDPGGVKKNVIRYPITILGDLMSYLFQQGVDENEIDIYYHDKIVGRPIKFNMRGDKKPRDYQQVFINAIRDWEHNNILIDLPTGYGKTFVSMSSITQFQKVFGIIVLPRYINKWIEDVTTLTDITKEEILVIQGLNMLVNVLLESNVYRNNFKVFIISLTTMNLFIKTYLNNPELLPRGITPETLFEILEFDIVLNDETHQEFHNVYKAMLFSNTRLMIGLTATLVTKDDDLSKIYKIMFPDDHRLSNVVELKRYIDVYSVRFRFRNPKYIRYKNNFGYNQPLFESSILKHSVVKKNYFEMLYKLTLFGYKQKRVDGGKLIVFMGTVEMCKNFVEYLKEQEEYKDLKISKYTEEDPYETILESDIIVSTIMSAGTALDIPNLICVLQTVNIDSVQANIQTLGRLRELKNKPTTFIYIWSSDIPPHKKYNYNRLELFRPRAKSVKMLDYKGFI